MKAIVHIGTEKTGTTSIQSFLYQNRRKLRKAGFHFLQCAGKTNNRALPAYCLHNDRTDDFYRNLGISTLEARIEHKRKFIIELEKELGGLPSHIKAVVISSEHFHSRIRTEEEMDNVHELLSTYFSEIEIVCYLRDQITTCTSYYSTALKSGNPSSFAAFIERCKPKNYYFNYEEMLQNWERCFGLKALNVSLFSRAHFVNGDLLDDFTSKIDPDLVGKLNTNVQIENESLNPTGQALARAVNIAFPIRTLRPELAPLREQCRQLVNKRYKGKGRQLTPESQRQVFAAFADMNESLRLKFFPHEELILQPPAAPDNPDSEVEEEYVNGFQELLQIIRTDGRSVLEDGEYAEIYNALFSSINELLYKQEDKAKVKRLDRDELRFLRNVALQLEKRDVPAAIKLFRLVGSLDLEVPGVAQRLEYYSEVEKKQMANKSDEIPAMNKYMIRYHIHGEQVRKAEASEHYAEYQQKYAQWSKSVDEMAVGSTLNSLYETRIVKANGNVTQDSSGSRLGYTIINAASIEEAQAIALQCPLLEMGGTLEVSLLIQLESSELILTA